MWKSIVLATTIVVCILAISACATPPTATPKVPIVVLPTEGLMGVQTPVETSFTVKVVETPTTPRSEVKIVLIPTEEGTVWPKGAPTTVETSLTVEVVEVTPIATPEPCPTYTPGVPDAYYQPSEVILLGPKDRIPMVVAQAAADTSPIGMTLLRGPIELEKLGGTVADSTMSLYQVCDQSDSQKNWERVGDVVSIAYDNDVLADPNYLTASAAGNPPPVVFSPHHIGESPFGGQNPSADQAVFDDQWALVGLKGIRLPDDGACEGARKVFVFDTLPQNDYGLFSVATPSIPTPPLASGANCSSGNHGLFVSGLIDKVAPDAEIELYPVLNACGVGTLEGIEEALTLAVPAMPGPSVLNLSLGVVQEESHKSRYFSSENGKEVRGKKCPKSSSSSSRKVEDLCTLDTLLEQFRLHGGVIVAAAGNDSLAAPSPPPMQLPAAYETVIGVVGSNRAGARSCFSNFGKLSGSDLWVSAPAADGDVSCQPNAQSCVATPSPDCDYGVVGPVDAGQNVPGYAYWAGTSFAAPLVSGLAACVLSSCENGCDALNATNNVFERIKCGARPQSTGATSVTSPGRVISVPTTLSGCP